MVQEYFKKEEKIVKNYLPNTWFIEEPFDEEHKHWKLLAYLQRLDNNVKKGHILSEYLLIEKRYRDLESFNTTFNIVYNDKKSEKLFKYIYEITNSDSYIMDEIEKIVSNSLPKIKEKYLELRTQLSFIRDNLLLEKIIMDRRKNYTIYVEKCNCSIIEKYKVTKKGKIDFVESFFDSDFILKNHVIKDNGVYIKTKIALDSVNVIIPFALKFNLSSFL